MADFVCSALDGARTLQACLAVLEAGRLGARIACVELQSHD